MILVNKAGQPIVHALISLRRLRSPISDTIFRFTKVRDVTNREDVSQAAIYETQHTEDSIVTVRWIIVFSRAILLVLGGHYIFPFTRWFFRDRYYNRESRWCVKAVKRFTMIIFDRTSYSFCIMDLVDEIKINTDISKLDINENFSIKLIQKCSNKNLFSIYITMHCLLNNSIYLYF